MTPTVRTLAGAKRNSPCHRPAPCGDACVSVGDVPHTIHACGNQFCIMCHGGAVHAAAMEARRRAAAELVAAQLARAMAETMAEMGGLDDLGIALEELEY